MSSSSLRWLALHAVVLPMVFAPGVPDARADNPKADRRAATTRKISKRSFAKQPKKIAAATPAPAPAPELVPTSEPVWTIDDVSPAPPAAPAPIVSTTSTTSAVVSPAAEAPVTPAKPIAATGLVLEVGPEIVVPATTFAPGSTVGPGLGLDVRGGYYVSSHIGIVAGMRGSFAHHVSGCDGCTGMGFQLPVVVQFAASRTRGAYGEAGVGLLSFYEASKGDVKASVSTPVVLKVGGGYRIGSSGSSALERPMSADVRLGVDVGRMTTASAEVGGRSASASIDNPTVHLVVGAGIIGHFAL